MWHNLTKCLQRRSKYARRMKLYASNFNRKKLYLFVNTLPCVTMLNYFYKNKKEIFFINLYVISIIFDIFFIRFKVTHILSQARDKWEGRHGSVSDELLKELVGECSSEGCVFICGPKGFMLSAKKYIEIFIYYSYKESYFFYYFY